jgi:hypothetical protein
MQQAKVFVDCTDIIKVPKLYHCVEPNNLKLDCVFHEFSPPPIFICSPEISTFDIIIMAVTNCFAVSLTEIRSPRRNTGIVDVRAVSVFLARKYTKLSLSQIGLKLNREHTSILHLTRYCELKDRPGFQEKVDLASEAFFVQMKVFNRAIIEKAE